jgi:DNA-binding transcriptional regulator YbjK
LDGHGREASAVATAAKTAANEVRQVKSQLSELRSTLGQYGITVDAYGSRVVPPTNLSSLPPALRTLVQGVTRAGQQSLDQIRQAADHADGLLAGACQVFCVNRLSDCPYVSCCGAYR